MRIVLNTNVLVSGVLNAYGAPGRILDFILAGSVQIAYDDRLIGEYADVLSRPKFGFEPARIRTLLNYLRLSGQLVAAPPHSWFGLDGRTRSRRPVLCRSGGSGRC